MTGYQSSRFSRKSKSKKRLSFLNLFFCVLSAECNVKMSSHSPTLLGYLVKEVNSLEDPWEQGLS